MRERIRWINGVPHECRGEEAVKWDAEFRVCEAIISTVSLALGEEIPVLNYEPGRIIINPEVRQLRAHIPNILGRVYRDQNGVEVPRRLGEVYFYGDVWENPICLIHAVEEPYEAHIHKALSIAGRPLEALAIEARPVDKLFPYDRLHLGMNFLTLSLLESGMPPIEARLEEGSPVSLEDEAYSSAGFEPPSRSQNSREELEAAENFMKTNKTNWFPMFLLARKDALPKDALRYIRYMREILEKLYEQIQGKKQKILLRLGWHGGKSLREILEEVRDAELSMKISDEGPD